MPIPNTKQKPANTAKCSQYQYTQRYTVNRAIITATAQPT